MFINPMLGGLTLSLVRPPEARRVERAAALAGVSRIARAARAQHDHDRRHLSGAAVTAAALDAVSPHWVSSAALADETIATLNAIRAADAAVCARAMVAAAKATGPVAPYRLRSIFAHLAAVGADEAERTYVLGHLAGPPDLQSVVDAVHDEIAATEAYAASALMVDPSDPAGGAYLAALAARLDLLPKAVQLPVIPLVGGNR